MDVISAEFADDVLYQQGIPGITNRIHVNMSILIQFAFQPEILRIMQKLLMRTLRTMGILV